MSDTVTSPLDRDALVGARDQMRREHVERLRTVQSEDSRRYEEAWTKHLEASSSLETAKLRLNAAQERKAEWTSKADGYEADAAKLPADAAEREELLERAAKARAMATTEDELIERAPANIARLEAQAAEHKAAADAIDAENTAHFAQINAAEDELDKLDDKIRLLDRERDAAANAREADNDAEALEMQGDPDGAAARRAEAARFRAEAEQAAREGAAISVDNGPLTDAGIDVPTGFEVTGTGGDTPVAPSTDPAPAGNDTDLEVPTATTAADVLSARAEAMADRAAILRQDLLGQTEEKMTEIDIARDRAARERYGAEQSAEAADIQVARENREALASAKLGAAANEEAAAARARGDAHAEEEALETASSHGAAVGVHNARAKAAEQDAAALRAEAEQHAAKVAELEAQHADLRAAGSAAGTELDKIEDQARLVAEAGQKLAEAEKLRAAGDTSDRTIGTIGELEAQAQRALDAAAKIDVDTAKITAVMPGAEVDTSLPTLPGEEAAPSADATSTGAEAGAGAAADDDLLGLRIESVEPGAVDAEPDPSEPETTETTETTESAEVDTAAGETDTSWLADYVEDPAPVAGADLTEAEFTPASMEDDLAPSEDLSTTPQDDATYEEFAE